MTGRVLTLVLFMPLLLLLACTPILGARQVQSAGSSSPEQSMRAAEERYRQALISIKNGNLEGVRESDQALEDMEDALHMCAETPDCAFWQLLVSYKRLLKLEAEVDAGLDDEIKLAATIPDEAVPSDKNMHDEEAKASAPAKVITNASTLLKTDDHKFRQMVQMTPAVQAGIRRWLTDMRASLISSHENYQYMQHLMSPTFAQRGLPEALLFGIMAKESNGRVHSISRSGAVGPLQFMPSTGRRFGLGVDASGFDTRYDPHKAADAAARYLLERLSELGPNIEYWLAAYNGGEGRARRVHAQTGGRNFWDLDVYGQFPPETRDYVPMVIAAAWLYLHPDEYGLSFPNIDATPATITLARSASIYELTICLGNDDTREGYMRVLRNLNPSYQAETWIPAGTSLNATARMAGLYRRWCNEGPRAELARKLIEADPQTAEASAGRTAQQPILPVPESRPARASRASARSTRTRTHSVRKGEVLGTIAKRYRCNLKTLAAANNVRAPRYFLNVGQRLKLEGCAG